MVVEFEEPVELIVLEEVEEVVPLVVVLEEVVPLVVVLEEVPVVLVTPLVVEVEVVETTVVVHVDVGETLKRTPNVA